MKKLSKIATIFTLIFTTLFTTNVHALTPETFDRKEQDNLGVNKKWKITNDNKNIILNTHLVDPSKKIYDFSDILTEEEENDIKEKIDKFREKTKMEIVIVTDELKYTVDEENEYYASDFYDYNDFGLDDENYSGILLFRNTYQEDPFYHMATFGNAQLYYGSERVDKILDRIYGDMTSQRYHSAFDNFITLLQDYYEDGKDPNLKGYTIDDMGYLKSPPYKVPWLVVTSISAVITTIIMIVLISKNKMVLKATKANKYLDTKSVLVTKREDKFISTHTTHYTTPSSSGGSGGGSFHSHGGSSGGGHGGGGRHG